LEKLCIDAIEESISNESEETVTQEKRQDENEGGKIRERYSQFVKEIKENCEEELKVIIENSEEKERL
jgi:hypothetical protein